MRGNCLGFSSASIRRKSLKAPGLAWRWSSAWSTGITAVFGRKEKSRKGQRSILPCQSERNPYDTRGNPYLVGRHPMNQELRILILEDRAADAELVLRQLRKASLQFTYKRVMTEGDYQNEI